MLALRKILIGTHSRRNSLEKDLRLLPFDIFGLLLSSRHSPYILAETTESGHFQYCDVAPRPQGRAERTSWSTSTWLHEPPAVHRSTRPFHVLHPVTLFLASSGLVKLILSLSITELNEKMQTLVPYKKQVPCDLYRCEATTFRKTVDWYDSSDFHYSPSHGYAEIGTWAHGHQGVVLSLADSYHKGIKSGKRNIFHLLPRGKSEYRNNEYLNLYFAHSSRDNKPAWNSYVESGT